MLFHLLILGNADLGEVAEGDYHGDVFIGLGMTDTGGEEQVIALGLIEDKALEDTCLAIVVIETAIESGLGEGLGAEDSAVLADDAQDNTIVDKLLTCLVLDHGKRVAGSAGNLNLVLLAQPLNILNILIVLHTDRCLRLRDFGFLHDDIIVLFFLTTTCSYKTHKSKGHD